VALVSSVVNNSGAVEDDDFIRDVHEGRQAHLNLHCVEATVHDVQIEAYIPEELKLGVSPNGAITFLPGTQTPDLSKYTLGIHIQYV
jgi:hypothetical protein